MRGGWMSVKPREHFQNLNREKPRGMPATYLVYYNLEGQREPGHMFGLTHHDYTNASSP